MARKPKGNTDKMNALLSGVSLPTVSAQDQQVSGDALILHDDGAISYKRFRLDGIGLEVPENVTVEEADEIGSKILVPLHKKSQLWIGDWSNIYVSIAGASSDDEISKVYDEIAEHFGLEHRTIKNHAWTCRNVPRSIRYASPRGDALTYTHYRIIAAAPEHLREHYIQLVVDQNLSTRELQKMILDEESAKTPLPPLEMSFNFGKTFDMWLDKAEQGDRKAKSELRTFLQALREKIDQVERDLGL